MRYEHLIGLPFIWGKQDCFELSRRFYRDNFEIEIRDYARPSDWNSDMIDLLRHAPVREGFEIISNWTPAEIRPGDAFCMSIGSANSNHIGIYVGDNKFVHHLVNRQSTEEEFRDFWLSRINYILRHPQVPDLRPVKEEVTIARLLLDRYNPQVA